MRKQLRAHVTEQLMRNVPLSSYLLHVRHATYYTFPNSVSLYTVHRTHTAASLSTVHRTHTAVSLSTVHRTHTAVSLCTVHRTRTTKGKSN
jgi:hypothetical protein